MTVDTGRASWLRIDQADLQIARLLLSVALGKNS